MTNLIVTSLILPLIVQFCLLFLSPSPFLYWGVFLVIFFLLSKFFPENKKRFFTEFIIFLFLFLIFFSLGQSWIFFHPSGEHIRDYSLLASSIANPLNPNEPWMSYEANHYYIYWYKWAASFSYLFNLKNEQTYVFSFCLSFVFYISVVYLFLQRIIKIKENKAILLSFLPAIVSNFEGLKIFTQENFNWWTPSRVIYGAITEFPMWTFFQGDFHPHFPSLMLTVLYLFFSFASLRIKAPRYNRLVYLSLIFVFFYRLYMIANPWDVIFLAIAFGGILLSEFFVEQDQDFELSKKQNIFLLTLGFLLIIATFLYPPLLQTKIKLAFVTTEVGRSTLRELFSHWGYWIISFLFIIVYSFLNQQYKRINSNIFYFFILSVLLITIPEIIFIDDPYGPPNERMNFIFKMYMPAWTMTGILISIFSERIFGQKTFWLFIITFLIVGNIFNFKVIPERIKQYSQSIDRLDYADKEHPGIKSLILKFREYPNGITVQSSIGAYDYTSFISTLSNKDLYLGWINHVMLFVPDYSLLLNRQSFVKAIYEEVNCDKKKDLLKQIEARYLVVSMQEKKDYPKLLSTDFSCLNKIIYDGDNFIFQIN